MGICCSSHIVSAEDFINFILNETIIHKSDYLTFQESLIHLSDLGKINKNVFDVEILPTLYTLNNNDNRNLIYHENLFEDILITDQLNKINVIHTLICVFSLVSHKNVIDDFYSLIQLDKQNITFKKIKKIMKTYLEVNLIVVTNSIYNTLINKNGKECERIDLEYLVNKVFTSDNVDNFIRKIFEDFEEKTEISQKEFRDFFMDKKHLFSFWSLRSDFMYFYKRNHFTFQTMSTENN